MLDEHYVNPRLVDLYDLDSGWSEDRDFYLRLAEGGTKSILDIGCGTGLLCRKYAEYGHLVTGVDPSPQMLEIGKKKPYGDKVRWIKSYAQDFHLEGIFDLIIMTGHAFQTLMTEEDVLLCLNQMRRHLAVDGQIVFESRNPSIDWSKDWNYKISLDSVCGEVLESRVFLSMFNDVLTFRLTYNFFDETVTSSSSIKFFSKRTLMDLLSRSGLTLQRLFGDWKHGDFERFISKEMIFVVQKEPFFE